eukprot:TRINITY_DN48476_c0_g1_i1.p1 TRINITY_DN48476_c0_g1~~TRINITY_DN48476_c0_g1_i1.p1  ORF type:complete len:388 (-),score=97.97 TRINITY_DN48476_c0_g1_i1:131-1294(-)
MAGSKKTVVDEVQALKEAGLCLERQDNGTRVIIRDVQPEHCAIRSRGGEALANFVAGDRKVRVLDLREASISDNDVGQLCLKLRQTDQLEELLLGTIGHFGLELMTGVVSRCGRLRKIDFQVQDTPSLHKIRQTQVKGDFNMAEYKKPPKKEGEEDSEADEGEEDPAGEVLDEEELQLLEQKKTDELLNLFRENDYDSDDEGAIAERGLKPKPPKDDAAEDAKPNVSAPFRELLDKFVDAVDKKDNLVDVSCAGESVPADLQLDLRRAVERHIVAEEKRHKAKFERGARSANDALKDQMDELRQSLDEIGEPEVQTLLDGGEAKDGNASRIGMRSYVGRRLFAALGEALFECQRFKSKENEAVSTAHGEMAFISMYLRKHASEFSSR